MLLSRAALVSSMWLGTAWTGNREEVCLPRALQLPAWHAGVLKAGPAAQPWKVKNYK